MFHLDSGLTAGLNRLAQQKQVTVNTVLQAIWSVLLQRYSGTPDVVFGAVVSGRPSEVEGIERMIGLFINTIPVRVRSGKGQSFEQLILALHKEAGESTPYHYFPLYEVQSQTELKRELLNHLFVFENYPVEKELAGEGSGGSSGHIGGRIEHVEVFEQTGYDLEIVVSPGAAIEVRLKYDAGVYEDEMIRRIEGHWKLAAEYVVKHPEREVASIPMLTEAEREKIMQASTRPEAAYPKDKTIVDLFEEQVKRVPERVAVSVPGESLTYLELDRRAEEVAQALRSRGIGPESIVAVMLERSASLIVAMLGVLKAGGAYLPVDPQLPEERKAYMVQDSGAKLVLTGSRAGEGQELGVEKLDVEQLLETAVCAQARKAAEQAQLPEQPLGKITAEGTVWEKAKPSNLAYVIYTSGTTGQPKGVMVEHRNVVSLMFGQSRPEQWFTFNEEDVWTMFHSFGFDFSVWEMYGALLQGGRLVIVPKEIVRSPAEFRKLLIDEQVTVLNQTPTAFQSLLHEEIKYPENELSLRYIIFAGEALIPASLKGWYSKYGDRTGLVNMYGITEITVHATFRLMKVSDTVSSISPIGIALDSLSAYVLGPERELLPEGVPGEIYIGGAGVARGYLNRPDLTAARFMPDLHNPEERMYRGGDCVRWLPEGELEHLGRVDDQVKIRGYRIELGEIEHRLLEHESVKEAAVTVRTNAAGQKELCAYVRTSNPVSVSELQKHLSHHLPEYMLPAHYTELEAMPMTVNGKLDRAALPEPQHNVESGTDYVAPQTELEQILADIWSQLLGYDSIGIYDNFFTLGGDSIKALQMASRLHRENLTVELGQIFNYPTIAELSLRAVKGQASGEDQLITGEARLTPIQRHYFAQQYEEEHHRNQSIMLYSKEGLEEAALRRAAEKIAEHHDALRMVFRREGDQVSAYNRGLEGESYRLLEVDLRGGTDVSAQIEAEAARMQAGFDLAGGPLLQLGWFRTDAGDHLLLIIHHLVVDGVSWRILFEDLASAYEQALAGKATIELQEKSHSFRTWSERLYSYAQSREAARELKYWREIDRTELLPLPRNEGKANRLKDSRTLSVKLDEQYTKRLLTQSHGAYSTEINDLLLTALGLTIGEWTGQQEVAVSLEGHGRENLIKGMNVTRTVGWFTSVYPVLLEVSRPEDTGYQIKLTKDSLRKVPNKGIGYGLLKHLREESGEPWRLHPEIGFNYMGQYDEDMQQGSGRFELSREEIGPQFSPQMKRDYVLDWNGMVQGGQLIMTCNYSAEEYKEEEIAGLLESYREQLERIADHCAERGETELTPGDLLYDGLSIEELNDLVAELDDLFADEPES